MPRKPNYRFERQERDRIKAAKKAARQEAKREKAEAEATEASNLDDTGDQSDAEAPSTD
jgi:hypothetical protein